jgi:chromosome segregation ATPase
MDNSVPNAFATIEKADDFAGEDDVRFEDYEDTAEVEVDLSDYADASEEKASIVSIVKGLEEQVETAFKLKEVIEAELDEAQRKLSIESAARVELEAHVRPIEAKAALVDQLREDISCAEEERDNFSNMLTKSNQQLETLTADHDLVTEELSSAKAQTKELEGDKMALEAQVMNLKDKIVDMGRLQKEKESLHKKLVDADNRSAELRRQLEKLQTEDKELIEGKERLEREMKALNVDYEAVKNELNAFKKVVRDIRGEVSRTTGRVHQRYFKKKS